MSNSKLNKLKTGIKNGTEVTLNLSSNVIGDSNDETNFPHKLLLTDRQVSKLCKAFANNSSANIKLSKTQISKIVQSGQFLGELDISLAKSVFEAEIKVAKKTEDILKVIKSQRRIQRLFGHNGFIEGVIKC